MKESTKDLLKVALPITTFIISVAITPMVKLYNRVHVLEERMGNRKSDVKTLHELRKDDVSKSHENDKDIYVMLGQMRERIATLEERNRICICQIKN